MDLSELSYRHTVGGPPVAVQRSYEVRPSCEDSLMRDIHDNYERFRHTQVRFVKFKSKSELNYLHHKCILHYGWIPTMDDLLNEVFILRGIRWIRTQDGRGVGEVLLSRQECGPPTYSFSTDMLIPISEAEYHHHRQRMHVVRPYPQASPQFVRVEGNVNMYPDKPKNHLQASISSIKIED